MSSAGDSSPLRVGIIGCGFVAREHHVEAIAAAGGSVVATCDPDLSAARAVAASAGNVPAYGSAAELLADERVAVVVVCTPPLTHAALAVEALEAGRHVLVEKPAALSKSDCEAMIAARDRSGKNAAVAFNLRHHPLIAEARDRLLAGEIGPLRTMVNTWVGPCHRSGGWAAEQGSGADLLHDRGAHCCDLAHFLAGAGAERLDASGSPDGPVTIGAYGREGVTASLVLAEAPASANEIILVGEEGLLRLDLYAFDSLRSLPSGHISGALRPRLTRTLRAPASLPAAARMARLGGVFRAGYQREWEAFAELISGRQPKGLATLEDGLTNTVMLNAAAAALNA